MHVCDYVTVCVSPWEGRGGRRNPLLFCHLSGFCNCLHLTPPQQNLETSGFHEKAGRNLEAYLILLQTLSCSDLVRWQQLQKYWSSHCPKPCPQHHPRVSSETPPPMSPRLKVLRDPAGVPGLQADSAVLCLTDAEYFYYLPIEP